MKNLFKKAVIGGIVASMVLSVGAIAACNTNNGNDTDDDKEKPSRTTIDAVLFDANDPETHSNTVVPDSWYKFNAKNAGFYVINAISENLAVTGDNSVTFNGGDTDLVLYLPENGSAEFKFSKINREESSGLSFTYSYQANADGTADAPFMASAGRYYWLDTAETLYFVNSSRMSSVLELSNVGESSVFAGKGYDSTKNTVNPQGVFSVTAAQGKEIAVFSSDKYYEPGTAYKPFEYTTGTEETGKLDWDVTFFAFTVSESGAYKIVSDGVLDGEEITMRDVAVAKEDDVDFDANALYDAFDAANMQLEAGVTYYICVFDRTAFKIEKI